MIAAIFLGICGISVLIFIIRGLIKKKIRVWKVPTYLLTFLVFMAIGTALFATGLFLQTFARYTAEEHVGWVYADKDARSRINMEYYDSKSDSLHQFELYGDQWMIEAKFIRWDLYLRFLGKGAFYKIVRFSGRWEKEGPYSFYNLDSSPGMWEYVMKYYETIPFIETAYGIGAFQYAMGDTFDVYINDTGFILRRR